MFYFKSPFNRHCLITNAARTGKLRTTRGVYVTVVEIAVRHQILLTYGLRATLDKAFGELEINIPPVEFEKVKMNFLSKALSLFCFLHWLNESNHFFVRARYKNKQRFVMQHAPKNIFGRSRYCLQDNISKDTGNEVEIYLVPRFTRPLSNVFPSQNDVSKYVAKTSWKFYFVTFI